MPEPFIFIRGFPQSFLEQPASREGLLNDLKALIGLSDRKLAEVRDNLTKVEGFLDPKALLSTIRRVVEDTNAAEAVRRILRNIGSSQVDGTITFLEEERKKGDFPFDQTEFERLKLILKDLIQPYPALARFQKAKRLEKITGQQLETVELICDLRPIFDENREKLEGMMPYTRLHIVAASEVGLPMPFEVELTHQQVIDLLEKVEKAKDKLEALRQSVERWLPGGLPELSLTRIPSKESSDV